MVASSTSETAGDGSQGSKEEKEYRMPIFDLKEDVVISGFAGRYPECENVEELKHNLFAGVDMVTDGNRYCIPGTTEFTRTGKVKDIIHFDAAFFGISPKHAVVMDPIQRLILEVVYEAIVDSGYDPSTLRGKNIGVYCGCALLSLYGEALNTKASNGYELLGITLALVSNRISFMFDFQGPSFTLDSGCSSAAVAMNLAMEALRSRQIDAAIVCGASVNLTNKLADTFAKIRMVAPDGKSKSFDASADGFARSETIAAMFLQKASDARRNYATILHIKAANDGFKNKGIIYPSSQRIEELIREVYGELGLDRLKVDYFEAHAAGTKAGDKEESDAIANFFCPGRTKPLLVGSVKTNTGHSEPASVLCGLSKVILAFEQSLIPANLHYKQPNPNIAGLMDGRLKVITENTPITPTYASVNSFGMGGTNIHMVLQANQRTKPEKEPVRTIPRLVLASGRHPEGVQKIFQKIEEQRFSDEALVLLEEVCKAPTTGMSYRGYGTVLNPGEPVLNPVIELAPRERAPVWFLFSGMGSQWSGMGSSIMKLDIIGDSIRKSAALLKPHGVDLIHLLTKATEEELNHPVYSLVTINAIQVALVKAVQALGIEPDGIVGHSMGEIACGFSDGCLTEEQSVLTAFFRGNSCTKVKLTHGAMAAVGLSFKECLKRCPEGIYPACDNSNDSVTISGPAEKIQEFAQKLKSENVFARVVKSCDVAFHSKYVAPVGDIMRAAFQKVIPNPLPRSARWISSSVPEKDWSEPFSQVASAEYHVHNFLNTVLFRDAMSKVPQNALIIEFAPHTLLKAIIKRTHGETGNYIGLMEKGHPDNLKFFLDSIGKMYISNLNPSARNLYAPISYPVPRGTAMLNSIIGWDRKEEFENWTRHETDENRDLVTWDTKKGSPYEYLSGHIVGQRALFPLAGYLCLAWKALALNLLVHLPFLPVIFEDVVIEKTVPLSENGDYTFRVECLKSDGQFRIVHDGSIVASGKVRRGDDQVQEDVKEPSNKDSGLILEANDFYKELRLRGNQYAGDFQGVLNAEAEGLAATILWDGNWVTFIDAMLQVQMLRDNSDTPVLATRIKSVHLDPRNMPARKHEGFRLLYNPLTNVSTAGQARIQGAVFSPISRNSDPNGYLCLEEQTFAPFFDSCILSQNEKKHLEEYSLVCSTMARRIVKNSPKNLLTPSVDITNFQDAPEKLVDAYVNSINDGYALLSYLNNSLKQLNSGSIDRESARRISKDILSWSILNERALLPNIQIVADNVFSKKLKVQEVSMASIVSGDILKSIEMFAFSLDVFDVSYTLLRLDDTPPGDGQVSSAVRIVQGSTKEITLSSGNDLTVAKDLLTDSGLPALETLKILVQSIKNRGFILLTERILLSPAEKIVSALAGKERVEQKVYLLEDVFKKVGLTIISKKDDQFGSVMYLLRKMPASARDSEPKVVRISDPVGDFGWIEQIKAHLKQTNMMKFPPPLWIVSDNDFVGVHGLVNCIKKEPSGKCIRYLSRANLKSGKGSPDYFDITKPFFKELVSRDIISNVIRDGELGMFYHKVLPEELGAVPRTVSFLRLPQSDPILESDASCRWMESKPLCHSQNSAGEKMTTVRIDCASLHVQDRTQTYGKDNFRSKRASQEIEFSGRDETGRRVMGLTESSVGICTALRVPESRLFPVPTQWSLEEACSVPSAYLTAYYALVVRAAINEGESVLINSSSDGAGVDQAAAAIALSMGCKVLMINQPQQRDLYSNEKVQKRRGQLILIPKDDHLNESILSATNGEGVDVVLNCAASYDKLWMAFSCLKANGRLLDVANPDVTVNSQTALDFLSNNISYHGISMKKVLSVPNGTVNTQLQRLFKVGIDQGIVVPLKSTIFNWDQIEEAYQSATTDNNLEKVIIKLSKSGSTAIPSSIPSIPRTYFSPDKSYLVVGGLGDYALEMGSWLVERGARNLVLSSRSGVRNGYQSLLIRRWEKAGAKVCLSHLDVSTKEGAEKLLKEAIRVAPVGGIFNVAMVLRDAMMINQSGEKFKQVCDCKPVGLHHLDHLSRQLCPQLDHFVAFTSLSSGRGNAGQSSYGYANACMERIAEARRELGYPGLAIQWGYIGDVGVIFRDKLKNDDAKLGTFGQSMKSCLAALDRFLNEGLAVVSSNIRATKLEDNTDQSKGKLNQFHKILGIKDPSTIRPGITLLELGMDSLMGHEIQNILLHEYHIARQINEIRDTKIEELDEFAKEVAVLPEDDEEDEEAEDGEFANVPEQVLWPLNDSPQQSNCVFFLIPEGKHTDLLRTVAQKLSLPAYGLLFDTSNRSNTIQDIASFCIEQLREVQPYGPYYLVGCGSAGSLVSMEMALKLQKTDLIRNLVFIDGCLSQESSPQLTNQQGPSQVEDIARRFFSKQSGKTENDFRGEFYTEDDIGKATLELDYLSSTASTYQSTSSFRGKVTLIKPRNVSRDVKLREKLSDSVEIISLGCTPLTLFQDPGNQVSDIINNRI